jgi:predicted HD phosphohydrolase
MVDKHGIFQGYYFFHHLGLDRNMRDQFSGHEYYDYTEEFCRKYDQNSFDTSYKTMPLEDFVPALESVLAKPKHSILIAE